MSSASKPVSARKAPASKLTARKASAKTPSAKKVSRKSAAISPSVVVLGMHRSGTSMITRGFNLLGYAVPRERIGINASNESGHWESRKIARLNDALLGEAGLEWSDWVGIDLRDVSARRRTEAREDIANALKTEFGDAAPIVLKEPRICRLAGLYHEIMEETGLDPVYVLPLRNPLEVMASLEARNGMPREDGALLWLRYMLDAERGTRGRRRLFARYEDALDDPVEFLERCRDALGLTPPLAPSEAAVSLRALADPDKRHHSKTAEHLAHDPLTSGWVSDAYEAVCVMITDPDHAASQAVLDRIAEDFATATPALLARRQAVRDRVQSLQAEQERTRTAQETRLAEMKTRLADTERSLRAADRRSAEVAEESKRSRKEAKASLAAMESRLAEAAADAKSKAEDVQQVRDRLEQSKTRLEEAKARLERADDDLNQARKDEAKAVAQIRERDESLRQQRSKIRSLNRENWKLRDQMSVANDHYRAIQDSTSWRITKPIRVIKNRLTGASSGPALPPAIPQPSEAKTPAEDVPTSSAPGQARPAPVGTPSRDDVEKSGLFDPAYYVAHTPSAARGDMDPLDHFLKVGLREGRDPSSRFVTKAYLAANPDAVSHPGGVFGHFLAEQDAKRAKQARSDLGRVVVFAAISGGYDTLKEPPEDVDGVDYVLFTDTEVDPASRWQVRPFEFVSSDPTRTARFIKTHPHLYFADYDWAVWVDANLQIEADIRDVLAVATPESDALTWIHPLRTTLAEEAEACMSRSKDDAELIRAQMERYRDAGFPDTGGLWETSVFATRPGTARTAEIMTLWWTQILQGSRRDQLGLPYAAWKADMTITPIARRGLCMRTDPRFHYFRHTG
ncbi:MAG: glycosyltransferase domain-containing protein [Litorimonas sp.]